MNEGYYRHHVFVCMNDRPAEHPRGCCGSERGGQIRDALARHMRATGAGQSRANKSGCLDRCELGPCLVVYPEQVWYRIDDIETDVAAIVQEHLVGGRVVARLVLPDRAD